MVRKTRRTPIGTQVIALATALLALLSLVERGAAQGCVGDCDGDCIVTVSELTRGVGIGLGTQDLSVCPGFASAEIDEIVVAVDNALTGCDAAQCPVPDGIAASLTHSFGSLTLEPFREIASQCVAWTLDNDEPLYVNKVTLANGGAYHHSNWFVVPENLYPGPDGFFTCRERGFDEVASAVNGTVIFAQSTQSVAEDQQFTPGAVIKIPPRHKVVAGIHVLNLQNREHTTDLRMSLGLVHPRNVRVILAPFRLSYYSLDVPPQSEAHFTTECDLASLFEPVAKRPLDMKLYWVLPHYHALGNFFRVEVMGGPSDGQLIHSLDDFNAEANGKALDPPLDLSGATGLRLTCGFRNPTDERVGWGIGNQEMCVMLGLADSDVLMDASVGGENIVDGTVDGIVQNHGACAGIAFPRNTAQTLPSEAERKAPLYVPESLPDDVDLPPVPECVDTPEFALAEQPNTLTSIHETVFRGSCTFSACHDAVAPPAGLDLASDGVHARLLNHAIVFAQTDLPLVAPGDPDGSWLMHLLSRCEPEDNQGTVVAHMPRNAPTLLQPELVAKVRDWILTGALDN